MKKNSVTLIDNKSGKTYEYPIFNATRGPSVVDLRTFFQDTGMFTYDPGYTSIASCESKITFIDGIKGELKAELSLNSRLMEIAEKIEKIALSDEYFVSRKLYPNIYFYTGIILTALQIPKSMFTPIFVTGRTVG